MKDIVNVICYDMVGNFDVGILKFLYDRIQALKAIYHFIFEFFQRLIFGVIQLKLLGSSVFLFLKGESVI